MRINRARLKKLARITLECEPEDQSYEGAFDDEEAVAWIRDQVKRGNEWAWCVAHVTASFAGAEGEDWLGGCSYESKASFMADGGYYPQMVDEAVDELAKLLEGAFDDPCLLETDEHQPATCIRCIADA